MSMAIDEIGLEFSLKKQLMVNFTVVAEKLVNWND